VAAFLAFAEAAWEMTKGTASVLWGVRVPLLIILPALLFAFVSGCHGCR
jgi:hypothetical protein